MLCVAQWRFAQSRQLLLLMLPILPLLLLLLLRLLPLASHTRAHAFFLKKFLPKGQAPRQ